MRVTLTGAAANRTGGRIASPDGMLEPTLAGGALEVEEGHGE